MNGPAAVIAARFLTRYAIHTEFGVYPNVPVTPAPRVGSIDLGCYVSRMSRIRELGVKFVNNAALQLCFKYTLARGAGVTQLHVASITGECTNDNYRR